MIFVANVLELNGGTTFLLRTCQALQEAGRRCAVLVLRPGGDAALTERLSRYAHIHHLADFQYDRARLFRKQLSALAPIAWSRLATALRPYGTTLHAMGGLGLIVASRLARRMLEFRVTVGVYHQNEFLYESPRFFSAALLALFRRVPTDNVLFFNEISPKNYSAFHGDPDYLESMIVPIGIPMTGPTHPVTHRSGTNRIVSVGNLEEFKTYNAHVIDLLPVLHTAIPNINYHIYGSGEERVRLEARARKLGVDRLVVFHGRIPYEALPTVWESADLFVGSGTAIIEAAATGLPALIGVESMDSPLTYGFLSDIPGLSYNERGIDLPMRSLGTCIANVLQNDATWYEVAAACAAKAQDFSVKRTAQGFMILAQRARATPNLLSASATIGMLLGLPALMVRDRLKPAMAFAKRRNQSFQVESACR